MNSDNIYRTGIDIGSTTLKTVVLDDSGAIVHKSYVRHKTDINGTLVAALDACREAVCNAPAEPQFSIKITGSAGMGIAERCNLPFMQEVVAAVEVAKKLYPAVRTLIDLGGEDAKMVFFADGRQPDIRMNGSCAGGTGAFIDQMADLMNIAVEELGELAAQGDKIYPVASRCGVFAKTDVQNLIAREATSADIALSILHAVALQSITTLARGHEILPKILCIGGPLTFIPALRKAFVKVLGINAGEITVPENSQYFPAWGCALLA
ncbi:MAG: acyl-CoA dehydratase activase [Bacteroidales bacterium]|jgi:predicted CoA-substrate-specific enzyme activase|nr:acyl-CoA dehydratase activase [Bacteroidales bacterium]